MSAGVAGRPVASFKNPWAWCAVAGGLVIYTVLSDVLVAWWVRLEALMPWGVTLLLPPVLYAVVLQFFFRPLSSARWATVTLGLWGVHLFLGMTTVAFVALIDGHYAKSSSPAFPPPPVPQILWVPLLLIPLRDLVISREAPRVRGRGGADPRRTDGAARHRPAAPAPSAPLVPSPAAEEQLVPAPAVAPAHGGPAAAPAGLRPGSRPVRSSPAPAAERPTSVLVRPTSASARPPEPATPSAAQQVLEQMLSEDPDVPSIRIPFERVASQFPPEVFRAPEAEVAAALREPGLLLVPQRMALLQLEEGVVRIGWEVVSTQFPRDLLAVGDEGIRRRLPDGQILLPLDEVVRQMPAELFAAAMAASEPEGLAGIPDIFHVDPPEASAVTPAAAAPAPVRTPPAAGPPMVPAAPVQPRVAAPAPAPLNAERQASAPPAVALDPPAAAAVAPAPPAATTAMRPDERAPVEPPRAAAPAPPPVSAPAATAGDDGVHALSASRGLAAPAEPASRERDERAPAAADPSLSEDEPIASLRGIAERLSPLVPLDMAATEVDGVRLLTLQSPVVDPYLAVTAAHAFVPLVADPRAPWAIDQVTLRGPDAAVILTPLGGPGAGVLVAAVPRCGSLALLELVCRRQARAAAGRGAGDHGAADADVDLDPELIEMEPSTRIRRMASALDAVGPVRASALRDPEGQHALYLFLPDGSDVRGAGGLTAEVARALRRVGPAGTFDTVVLRGGRQHMVIRLAGPDDTAVVAAAGETRAPGLAHRQVAEVAGAVAAS